jgi:hypothetical protein
MLRKTLLSVAALAALGLASVAFAAPPRMPNRGPVPVGQVRPLDKKGVPGPGKGAVDPGRKAGKAFIIWFDKVDRARLKQLPGR